MKWIQKFRKKIFPVRAVLIYQLDRIEDKTPQPDSYYMELISQDNLQEVIERYPDEPFRKNFIKYIPKGGIACCLWDREQLIYRSIAYAGKEKVLLLGKSGIEIPGNWYYICNCWTHVDYRGQGLYPAMLKKISDYLFEKRKASGILIVTDLNNYPSQRGILRAGFRLIRAQVFLTVFWKFGNIELYRADY